MAQAAPRVGFKTSSFLEHSGAYRIEVNVPESLCSGPQQMPQSVCRVIDPPGAGVLLPSHPLVKAAGCRYASRLTSMYAARMEGI